MSLDLAIRTVDELIHEVDTTIRSEFSELGDRLDEVIMLLQTTDRSDVGRLTSQLARMQAIMEMGTQCTCIPEARWHACLGRLSVAISGAAARYNVENVKLFCEEHGVPFEEIMDLLKLLSPDNTNELPAFPDNITIPDNPSELT